MLGILIRVNLFQTSGDSLGNFYLNEVLVAGCLVLKFLGSFLRYEVRGEAPVSVDLSLNSKEHFDCLKDGNLGVRIVIVKFLCQFRMFTLIICVGNRPRSSTTSSKWKRT